MKVSKRIDENTTIEVLQKIYDVGYAIYINDGNVVTIELD